MECIAHGLRLEWVREHSGVEATNPDEKLLLKVERLVDGQWRSIGTESAKLSVFPAAAPEAMRRGALEVFARVLNEVEPDRQEAMITHLLWYELTDRDVIQAALQHVAPGEITEFLFALGQLEPRAAQRALAMASDEQLAAITADGATALVRHPNPEARAPLLLALRDNSRRLTGLR